MEMVGILAGYGGWVLKTEEGMARRKVGLLKKNEILHIFFRNLDYDVEKMVASKVAKMLGTRPTYLDGHEGVCLFDIDLENLRKIANIDKEKKVATIRSDIIERLIREAEEEVKRKKAEEAKQAKIEQIRKILYDKFAQRLHTIDAKNALYKFIREIVNDLRDITEYEDEIERRLAKFLELDFNNRLKDINIRLEECKRDLDSYRRRYSELEVKYDTLVKLIKEKLDEDEIIDFFKKLKEQELIEEIKVEFKELFDDENDY